MRPGLLEGIRLMDFEWVNIIQIAIASPAIFTAIILVPRRNMRAIALLLAVFGLHMVLNVAEETGLAIGGLALTPALSALYGPLFYLLIRGLIFHERPVGRADLVHFVPFAIAVALLPWLFLNRIVVTASLIGYSIATLRDIRVYHRATLTQRSDADALRLNWVIGVFGGFILLTILDVSRLLTQPLQSAEFQQAAYAASLCAVASLFGVMAYYALNRPRYFGGLTDAQFKGARQKTDVAVETKEDFEKFTAIAMKIKEERLFLQPHLTLADVASKTLETERELSRLINLVGKRNFCDYINGLRAEEAARLLSDETRSKHTILEIAFEAGFTSKSTFNAVFKKEMGPTPSQYRKQSNKSSEILVTDSPNS